MISNKAKKQIDAWVAKYPEGHQSSAVMEALKIVQAENDNRLTSDTIQAVADYLDMPGIAAAEVATFYENYNHKPVGKHTIRFCHQYFHRVSLHHRLLLVHLQSDKMAP